MYNRLSQVYIVSNQKEEFISIQSVKIMMEMFRSFNIKEP